MIIFAGRINVEVNPGTLTSTLTGRVFQVFRGASISYTAVQFPLVSHIRLAAPLKSSVVGNPVTPITCDPAGRPARAPRLKLIGLPP